MDLNRLSVVVKPDSSGFSIDYSNNNRKFVLDNVTFLSSGSYGEVYKFSKGNYGIAVKTYKYNDDDEIGVLNMLKRKNTL